jgi:hypothetical protein
MAKGVEPGDTLLTRIREVPDRIPVATPSILIDGFRGFTQSVQVNFWIVA